jgi:DNA-binding NtrC family response regulator
VLVGVAPVGISLAKGSVMPRFLVVDDDPAAVNGMSYLLVDDGHTVAPFTCGAEAVEALSQDSFDAVVTDLEMPNVDGLAVVRAAREHQPHACLVVATARGPEKWVDLVQAGACIVADKPIEYEAVTTEIAACRARGITADVTCARVPTAISSCR